MTDVDTITRLGFEVNNLDSLIEALKLKNIKIVSEIIQTTLGKIAIIEDLDGRKIELTEIEH